VLIALTIAVLKFNADQRLLVRSQIDTNWNAAGFTDRHHYAHFELILHLRKFQSPVNSENSLSEIVSVSFYAGVFLSLDPFHWTLQMSIIEAILRLEFLLQRAVRHISIGIIVLRRFARVWLERSVLEFMIAPAFVTERKYW